MHEHRGRQLVVAIGIQFALAGLTALPSHGQGSDSALAHLSLVVMYDASAFAQDTVSERQVDAIPTTGRFRMVRVYVSGLVKVQRAWRYLISVDVVELLPETTKPFSINDLAVIVPVGGGMELAVGRQKEGITEQMMASSRALALTERPAPVTAFVPTRNDGVRLIGGDARHGRWSVGWLNPEIAAAGPMLSGANEFAGRVFFAPTDEDEGKRLVQVGGSARWKGAPNGSLRFRTRPETNSAPDFPDTKSFDARGATTLGVDALVQRGAVSVVVEALLTDVERRDSTSLNFRGYYVEASWRPAGESRAYDAKNGALGRVRLRDQRPAWEISGRASHTNLSSEDVDGGVFDRASAALSWRTSRSLLMVLEYGYGTLERGGSVGHTQFVTARVQWELR